MRRFFLAGIALVLLGAIVLYGPSCGSGDGDSAFAPPVPANPSPAGIWLGQITSTAAGPLIDPNRRVTGVVSEDLDVQFGVFTLPLHYSGVVAMDGDAISGTLSVYVGKQGPFFGFDGVQSIFLDGAVIEADGIFGDYTGAEDEGRFNLNFDAAYNRESSLDLMSGIWQFNQASAGGALYTVTLEIDGNGQLFGSDTAGCVFSGQIRIIDGRYNAYRAAVSVSNCGEVDGAYSGLAFLMDVAGGQMNQLHLSVSGARFALATGLGRM